MADAGNIVITHKDGGLVKHLSPEALARVMRAIQGEVGTELVINRKESTYVFGMEIATPPRSRARLWLNTWTWGMWRRATGGPHSGRLKRKTSTARPARLFEGCSEQ